MGQMMSGSSVGVLFSGKFTSENDVWKLELTPPNCYSGFRREHFFPITSLKLTKRVLLEVS